MSKHRLKMMKYATNEIFNFMTTIIIFGQNIELLKYCVLEHFYLIQLLIIDVVT